MNAIDHQHHPIRFNLRLILYWPWLMKEIVLANLQVARTIISRKMPLTLSVIEVISTQKTELGQVVYGNSITLTPGTVTIGIDQDIITVHALTVGTAFDLKTGEMNTRISNMESIPNSADSLVQTFDRTIK
jgi:multicomponent Na+:H+ antiporter subunit E